MINVESMPLHQNSKNLRKQVDPKQAKTFTLKLPKRNIRVLSSITVTITRKGEYLRNNFGNLKRSIDNVSRLSLHSVGEGSSPIFDRPDINVNLDFTKQSFPVEERLIYKIEITKTEPKKYIFTKHTNLEEERIVYKAV
ncbi:hypothetical protein Trydic_g12875 [Trypoxylus dichotomus]